MRDQLRIGSRLCWIVAWLLALAALGIAFAFDAANWTWWIGSVLLLPLGALTALRGEEKGGTDPYSSPGDGGMFGPPT